MTRNRRGWISVLMAVGLALAGCGKAGSRAGGGGFDTAAPELKAAWEKAVAADQTNDYVAAVLGFKQVLLQRDQLSPSQLKAVEDASAQLFQRLGEAASKGDPAAQQALTTLRTMERARRPR